MIVRTRTEWKQVVEKVRQSRDRNGTRVFAEDFETHDRGFPDTKLVGFSLGWYEPDDRIEGAYIPIGHSTDEMQLRPEDVNEDLKELNEDPDIQVVAHNAAYDILVSRKFPDPIYWDENIFDTMTVLWLLNTNGVGSLAQIETGNGYKGLKEVIKFLFDYKMTELTDLAPKEKYKKDGVEFDDLRVDKVPVQKLGDYAYDDAVEVLKLREMLLWGYDAYDRPRKRNLKKAYRKLLPDMLEGLDNVKDIKRVWDAVEREFIFSLVDMTEAGNELAKEILYDFRDDVADEMVSVRKNMFEARPVGDFDRLADADLVRKACEEFDRIDELCDLPPDHPNRPKNPKTGKPRGKGWLRNRMLKSHGLKGHPVEEKIRDDTMRQDLKLVPEVAHKVFNTNSVYQLNEVLFDECGLPPVGERGDSGLFSTDKDCIEVWVGQGHEIAIQLDRFREIDKLYGTYLIGMPAKVPTDGRVRTRFGRVRTGRLSSSDPNLQNIPTSDEFPIRTAFVATGGSEADYVVLEWLKDEKGNDTDFPKTVKVETPASGIVDQYGREFKGGWIVDDGRLVEWWGPRPPNVMMVGDYSQLEIRLLAHISKDPVLLKAVREGQDIHALTAQAVFDEVPNNISLDEVKMYYSKYRKDAKPVNFGIIYGMGPQALSAALGCSVDEAQDIINNRYMNKYKGVKAWIDWVHEYAMKNGYVFTATGRRRHLPAAQKYVPRKRWSDMSDKEKDIKRAVGGAKRQAQNTPIQGLAADVLGLAMRDTRRFFRATSVTEVAEDVQMDRAGNMADIDMDVPLWHNHVWYTLQIHDELVGESHPALANYFMDRSVELMENAGGMKLRVPLKVDAALGHNWMHTKE